MRAETEYNGAGSQSSVRQEAHMLMDPRKLELKPESLPPSCRGADGRFKTMTEEEHRRYIASALRRLDEIEEIPDAGTDPPDEVWMRGIDEMRPHRPLFKAYY
jgi:hypothetical protein